MHELEEFYTNERFTSETIQRMIWDQEFNELTVKEPVNTNEIVFKNKRKYKDD